MRLLLVVLALAALSATPAAAATPAPSCPGLSTSVDTFAGVGAPVLGWVENMGFDGRGGMWLSMFDGTFVRYDASGRPNLTLSAASPGASVLGPDGRMYVAFGDTLNAPEAGVLRFDPGAPALEPFATGVQMANGLAVDGDGNLYIGDTAAGVVQRVLPDGRLDPGFRVPAPGADGVVITGGAVYVALLTDPQGTILRVPLDDPAAVAPLTRLGAPLLLDDLDVGPDGALYVASAVGSVFRVDPTTGDACTLLSGQPPLTSARFPTAFPPYDALSGDLFLSSEAGEVLHAHVTGLQIPVPSMAVSISPRAIRARVRADLRVSVASTAAACRGDVKVRVGGRRARTDADGEATLSVRFTGRGQRPVRATKAGCSPASATLRVWRHTLPRRGR